MNVKGSAEKKIKKKMIKIIYKNKNTFAKLTDNANLIIIKILNYPKQIKDYVSYKL